MPENTPPRSPRHAKFCALTLTLATLLGVFGPHQSLAADAKASKYYEDALTRYDKKDLDGAIIQLKNALQIDKNMLSVQMLLGKALLQNGDVVAAEVALTEALRLGVNRAEVVIPLGQAYLAQGKQKLILGQPQFSLAGLPAAVQRELLLLRSAASADLGDLRGALKAIDEARAIDSTLPSVWLAEVPIRIRARQFREATEAAQRALALAPDSAEAWYQKGSILHVSGDLAATLAAYDKALTLEAGHVEARVARAGLYLDLGRQPEAASDVGELKRIAPKEPRAAYLRALLAERDNKPELARSALKDLVGLIDPVPIDFIRYRPQLLMLNGLAHFGLNEREKAKQYLEAFQKTQGNSAASKLLAQIYLGESNVDRAIEVLETYLKAQPADGQAMTLLGSALLSKGHHARAASLMQQALKTNDAPEFRTVLGLSLIRSGQSGNGVVELEAAYKKDPHQTQAATVLIRLYLRSGQASKAALIGENLVKQQPSNASFFNLLGMARGESGYLAGARSAFEQAIKLDDRLVSPKINLARLEIASKSYDAAAARLAAILKIDEKNTEAMYEMASLSDRRDQAAETQRWLEKANDLSGPKETRWGLALSDFHLRNGRPSPALEVAKQVSAKAPDDLSVLMAYAKAQLASSDSIGAKASLTSATRVADYNPVSQLQIAVLQLAANNVAGAAYSLEKALSGQPDYLPAMALMTEVELRQAEPAKAEKRARDIVAKNPKRAIGYSLLGDVAIARGQTPAALDAYRRAHQLEPSTDTLLRLFRTLAAQDGGKPAQLLAEQWMKIHPKDALTQRAMADGYARTGNFIMAKTAYEGLIKMSPDDSPALNNLANVMLRLKDPEAVKTSEQAVAKNPGNPNAIDTLGWALSQSGQNDRALQLLRDARLRDPGNPEIRYHLAVVLAQTDRKTEAREELEAALKSGQVFESSADAGALLKSLK
ncbi:XrtA/PEP-CTERM system TPR-repeat protein PrsT [Rhodoferax ferrireducens]|uniref:XrtA/PEP-CTERM system TPR-repeat protein PrsT n=1 Tax=Rhodoferax ferrireducens TaxID=192843 RepID=UPI000E0D7495|nr:XrtA/PEP-CTERM system TPR-repeat protein PrsT [Rhodoferax ferrireducens]